MKSRFLKPRLILPLALVAALPLIAACSGSSAAETFPPGRSGSVNAQIDDGENGGITVNGIGQVELAPDTAIVTLGVEVEADTVAEARDGAAEAAAAVAEAVQDAGVEERDIQTVRLNIHPRYDHPRDGERVLRGYVVSNIVRLTVRDIDAISAVVDGAVEAGGDAVRVDGIGFTVEDNEDAVRQARDLAVEDAAARAEQLAEATGVTLGDPISITETGASAPPPIFSGDGAAEDAARSTPVFEGTDTVRVTVSIRWAIE